jgi:hypothetical protein
MVDEGHFDAERTDLEAAGFDRPEVVDPVEGVVGPSFERAAQPFAGADRPEERELGLRSRRVVPAGVGVRDEVEAVVRVQVAEQDGIDLEEVAVPLQLAEGTVAGIDHHPEPV